MTGGEQPRFAKGPDFRIADDAVTAQLLAAVTALTAEVAILRDRVDAHERLSQARGGFGPEDVDRFEGDGDAQAARRSVRQRLIGNVFRVFLDKGSDGGTAKATRIPTERYEAFVGTLEKE